MTFKFIGMRYVYTFKHDKLDEDASSDQGCLDGGKNPVFSIFNEWHIFVSWMIEKEKVNNSYNWCDVTLVSVT